MFATTRRIITLTTAVISLLAALVFSFAQASTAVTPTRQSQADVVAAGDVADNYLLNAASAKCLDHEDWGNGLRAIVFGCNWAATQQWYTGSPSANQQWYARSHRNGHYEIVNVASGKCLDHEDSGNGLQAIVWNCNRAANQRWFGSIQ